jgi:subtilisin family serine protease
MEYLESRRLLAINWGPYPKLIDQDEAVERFPNITGKGVNVVVIDSGWGYEHPKLDGRLWTNPDEIAGDGIDNDQDGQIDNTNGWDYWKSDNHPDDENSHGTQMSGIIAGRQFTGPDGFEYQGLAPDAKIIPLKTIDGRGTIYTLSFARRVESALRWIEGNHKRLNISIVNLSIGVHKVDFDATIKDEVERLNKAGVLLIASSGHYGNRNTLEYPAQDPNVYSAGIVNENDKIPDKQQRGPDLDILGPGSNIPIMVNHGKYEMSGEASSYPTPFIVGAAALIKQINPDFTPAQIMGILMDSGKRVGDGTGNTYPRLDVDDAIRLAIRRSGGNPDPEPEPTQTPFKNGPFNVTSRIEAENFDNGGEGNAFHNAGRKNRNVYRRTPVELSATRDKGRGFHVTGIKRGEWLEYTVNVPAAGLYNFQGRFQSVGRGASFHIEVDGDDVSGRISIPSGSSKSKWRTISKSNVTLSAGRHVMRIFFDSATSKKLAGNFNWFRFSQA